MNSTTKETPYKILYGVDHTSGFLPSTGKNTAADEFIDVRNRIRADVADAIRMAQVKMAHYYDKGHTPMDLKGRVYLWLVYGTAVRYKLPGSTSISTIRVGPFTIKRKVNKLAYELDLPKRMKIHPIISIAHLEQAPDDPFNRQPMKPGPVVVDGEDQYVVDRIVGHEQRGR